MPGSKAEFKEESGFERYTLDRITPLLPSSEAKSVIELGALGSSSIAVTPQTARVNVGVNDSSGAATGLITADDVRPLLFGAAWKVLDLLVELGLRQAGFAFDDQRHQSYRIETKAKEARADRVQPVAPFDGHPALWLRIMSLYAATSELRDALVHREVRVDPGSGSITEALRPGYTHAPQTLTSDEQSAFCRAVVGVANAVTTDELAARQVDQIQWLLDRLRSKHGHPSFDASPVTGLIPQVILRPIPTSDELTIDFAAVRQGARSSVSNVSHYDLKIHLPDGRVLACPLEAAPTGSATFPISQPPDWLQPE